MPIEQILILALVQGLAEFLPISSSGHLVLVPHLSGWKDQGLAVDVAMHAGTLVAVLAYFWRDIWEIFKDLPSLFKGRLRPGARLALYICIGTAPAVIAGLTLKHFLPDGIRDPLVVAWAMVGFAVILYVFDKFGLTIWRLQHITLGQALFIGIAQCLAFIPGTSRAGATMVAARFLGYERESAARFSMLLSIPAILAAGVKEGFELYKSPGPEGLLQDALLAAGLSAVFGLMAIAFLMYWLKRSTFLPFVLYRLAFGSFLLLYFYGLTPWR
ncbi:MAG: undecaprenyl-diphosphate phosphatase [Rhodospirillales bacterium]